MEKALSSQWTMSQQDEQIAATFDRERSRLRNFVRRYVADPADAEDVLQDVFYELVEAYRMMKPVEHAAAWLFRVARNRVIDRFRRRKREGEHAISQANEDGEDVAILDMLPSSEAGPEAAYLRGVLLDELEAALEELPAEQAEVFIAHEVMGKSFKEIADETGIGVNTLLSRKRYAVLFLRERLRAIYYEFISR